MKPTADPLMSADKGSLTPKLRFGKRTYPFGSAQDPARMMIVELFVSMTLDLSAQLLGTLAGVVLDAHAHHLAEWMEFFVGEGVAGEVALVSGHEPSSATHPNIWSDSFYGFDVLNWDV